MMKVANAAAAEIEKLGKSVEVIDLRTVRPLDYATIVESVKKTNRLVIIEEAWPLASISSEISEAVENSFTSISEFSEFSSIFFFILEP